MITVGGFRDVGKTLPRILGLCGVGLLFASITLESFDIGLVSLLLLGIVGYLLLSTGDADQTEVQLSATRIAFAGVELPLRSILKVELADDPRGPVLEVEGADGAQHRLCMQLEPMEHAVWLQDNLRRACAAAQVGKGTRDDVPRTLRNRHLRQ